MLDSLNQMVDVDTLDVLEYYLRGMRCRGNPDKSQLPADDNSLSLEKTKEDYVTEFIVPGVDPTTIKLEVTGENSEFLSLSYSEQNENDEGVHERSGIFTIPKDSESKKITAECKLGILKIKIPRKKKKKPDVFKIEVKV